MKKLVLAALILAAAYVGWSQFQRASPSAPGDQAVASAFEARQSGVPVTGEGVVARILPDDRDGSRHQRFILSLSSGRTVLVSHNIDLAPRLASLNRGDVVAFHGVYEWNSQGGLVHWTHHDPSGRHPAGWLKHHGKTSQ